MYKTSLKQKIILIFFGIFLFIILLEVGMRIGGFIFLSLQEYRNQISIRQRGTYRIMCLGESTTALGGEESYPRQLEDILNKRNIGIKFSVINKGICGIKTSGIVSELESSINKYNPNMVLTMIGVNDRDAAHLPSEDGQDFISTRYLKFFKTYNLFNLLRLHITTKINEYRTKLNNENITKNNLKAEGIFKKTTELDHYNDKSYYELGCDYLNHYQYLQAEAAFKKALELNHDNEEAKIGLATAYNLQGQLFQAEATLKKAAELKPKNEKIYLALGDFYYDRHQYPQAEAAYKKALEINPSDYLAYTYLAWTYNVQDQCLSAEATFKKAIEINPNGYLGYCDLARFYNDRSQYAKAEAAFRKSLELNPQNEVAYCGLGWCCYYLGEYSQAELVFKKALEINPSNDEAAGGIATIYTQIRKFEDAEKYYVKANELRLKYYNPDTVNNYKEIKKILEKRGVQLVCVQYPMRRVEPLKKIFEETRGIIFVDNEAIFKKAVAKESYDDYFVDIFGGDFGHCTPKGNRLLGENIANVILREVFHR